MTTHITTDKRGGPVAWLGLVALAVSIFLSAWLLLGTGVARCFLSEGCHVILWNADYWRWLRWVLLGVALFAAAGAWLTTVGASRDDAGWMMQLRWVLRPLSLLPVAVSPILLPDLLPAGAVASIFPSVAALLAWALLRGIDAMTNAHWLDRFEWALPLFALAWLAYSLSGNMLARVVGEHLGDEGHYLAQAQSLYEDHDLDIQNDIMEKADRKPPRRYARRYAHISDASRGEHWYSYHPLGLPFLMAPLWGMGVAVRYVLLGLIGAFGVTGMYVLSRACGAGRPSSLVVTGLVAVSFPWVIYASRALPETLGATLLCWLFWAITVQSRRRWLSVFVGAACCGYLAVSHERFIPISLLGFGVYGLFGLFGSESWRRKIPRLAVFTLLCFCGYAFHAATQLALFENGMKLPTKGVLMTVPIGMWGIVAGERGIVSVLPMVVWLFGALILWPIGDRRFTGHTAFVLALLAFSIFVCSTSFYTGGSCVPGRYLFVLVPLFVPAAARLFERTSGPARWLLLFLSVYSLFFLLLTLWRLPEIGRGFILPVHALKKVVPSLAGLFYPHASFRYESPAVARLGATVYTAAALVLVPVMLALPRRFKTLPLLLVLCLAVIGATAHALQPIASRRGYGRSPAELAPYLAGRDAEKLVIEVVGGEGDPADVLRVDFPDIRRGDACYALTSQDLGAPRVGMRFSQPRLSDNDWAGRGHGWATMTEPFHPVPGDQFIHIGATLSHQPRIYFAIREGGNTLLERELKANGNRISADVPFTCEGGRGHLYVLVRIEGEGELRVDDLHWRLPHQRVMRRP